MTPVTPLEAITTAIGTFSSQIGPIAVVGLGVGATILAFTVGWKLVRKFAK